MVSLTEVFALAALMAAAVAAIAWNGDRLRFRRRDPDAVGCMPWTPVFFLALLAAVVLLGMAARSWLAG